jgi:hypothetical protein
MWKLQRACEIQHAAESSGRPLGELSAEVLERTPVIPPIAPGEPTDRRLFAALVRRIDALDQSYRS